MSEPEIARSMMTPDEVMRMSENEGLIFTSGHPAIRATKLRYFREPLFIKRARGRAPSTKRSDHLAEQCPSDGNRRQHQRGLHKPAV